MANEEHLKILKQGVDAWNQWRKQNPEIVPDLSDTDLSRANLKGVQLSGAYLVRADLSRAQLGKTDLSGANLAGAGLVEANLIEANLSGAHLYGAELSRANLVRVDLRRATLIEAILIGANLIRANLTRAALTSAILFRADLIGANLSRAILRKADLSWANLTKASLIGASLTEANLTSANLCGANLIGVDLRLAQLVQTNFKEANLTNCSVFGISAWDLELSGAIQSNLIITPPDEPTITVDNLEVAQFIYLLLNNEKIRDVIDTITTKVVLILGRFTPERKAVLDAIRDELRKRNYLPVLFDFDKPASRDLTETVRTLAHLARFIIADITEPRSIPQELQAIVPDLAVPVQPLLLEGSTGEYGMFQDLRKYDWVLEVYRYDSLEGLLASLGEKVIAPAEAKAKELERRCPLGVRLGASEV